MFTFQVLLLLESIVHLVIALFTIQVPRSVYVVQYDSTVNMTCTFPVAGGLRMKDLKVYWHQISSSQMVEKEIYAVDSGKENLTLQDVSYRGRATLLKDELYKGQAVLEISNVKLTDAGTYRCLIIYGGADYKQVSLQVQASFTKITTWTERTPFSATDVSLSCQSEGFPLPEVFWLSNGLNSNLSPSTSHTMTADGLYNVTSTLQIKPSSSQNYSCVFWNRELEERTMKLFHLADEEPSDLQRSVLLFIVPICLIAIISSSAVVFFLKRKSLCACSKKSQLNPPT
ncbi:programmed cell death 1 ligand 2 isoform X2 [Microcaecilia unicolor]|uniref:Programmed cell death 1 ligand 2-like isoform X2 n=1 Tax=Microcaecilia unicolor TaxID=1415580 RepID=A0A6P7X265_9AMPH|nr:programmed cell death 1 ligand 2-like isoform X2 [Microcaecilia unicolor]